jgi:hypothetical protein
LKEYFKSSWLFFKGIFVRIYWLLPALILDPFDLIEKWTRFRYNPPIWIVWLITMIGLVVAVTRTYHAMRMKVIKLEPPVNWIEDHRKKTGAYPPLPEYLVPVVTKYFPGNALSKDIYLKTPSRQYWEKLLPTQQEKMIELAEWLGTNKNDFLKKITRTFTTDK